MIDIDIGLSNGWMEIILTNSETTPASTTFELSVVSRTGDETDPVTWTINVLAEGIHVERLEKYSEVDPNTAYKVVRDATAIYFKRGVVNTRADATEVVEIVDALITLGSSPIDAAESDPNLAYEGAKQRWGFEVEGVDEGEETVTVFGCWGALDLWPQVLLVLMELYYGPESVAAFVDLRRSLVTRQDYGTQVNNHKRDGTTWGEYAPRPQDATFAEFIQENVLWCLEMWTPSHDGGISHWYPPSECNYLEDDATEAQEAWLGPPCEENCSPTHYPSPPNGVNFELLPTTFRDTCPYEVTLNDPDNDDALLATINVGILDENLDDEGAPTCDCMVDLPTIEIIPDCHGNYKLKLTAGPNTYTSIIADDEWAPVEENQQSLGVDSNPNLDESPRSGNQEQTGKAIMFSGKNLLIKVGYLRTNIEGPTCLYAGVHNQIFSSLVTRGGVYIGETHGINAPCRWLADPSEEIGDEKPRIRAMGVDILFMEMYGWHRGHQQIIDEFQAIPDAERWESAVHCNMRAATAPNYSHCDGSLWQRGRRRDEEVRLIHECSKYIAGPVPEFPVPQVRVVGIEKPMRDWTVEDGAAICYERNKVWAARINDEIYKWWIEHGEDPKFMILGGSAHSSSGGLNCWYDYVAGAPEPAEPNIHFDPSYGETKCISTRIWKHGLSAHGEIYIDTIDFSPIQYTNNGKGLWRWPWAEGVSGFVKTGAGAEETPPCMCIQKTEDMKNYNGQRMRGKLSSASDYMVLWNPCASDGKYLNANCKKVLPWSGTEEWKPAAAAAVDFQCTRPFSGSWVAPYDPSWWSHCERD